MGTTRRSGGPYVYITWLSPLLAGDHHCRWRAWFRSQFKADKVARDSDLSAWTADHTAMVKARVAQLTADGWLCWIEDQNAFRINGAVATLAGKPDIVAVKDTDARVIDCKTGKRRDGDYQQVLIYMQVAPLALLALKDKRVVGELQYRDGTIEVLPEELTPEVRDRIVAAIREAGGTTPPPRTPSAFECRFCDITKADCPDRIDGTVGVAAADGLF